MVDTIGPPPQRPPYGGDEAAGRSAIRPLIETLRSPARRFENPAAGSVSVVIPAYDEAATIAGVVERVRAALAAIRPRWSEVLVVDDGSTDRTGLEAERAGARVVSHAYNVGNGAAVKTGIRWSRGEAILLLDADGQHDPAEIEALLSGLARHDMVVGARSASGHAGVHRRLANGVLARFGSAVAGRRIPDLTSGFRALRRETAERFLFLLPNTFSYPTTLTLCCLRSGRTIGYVPISARKRPRGGAKSKIRIVDDGARFLVIILKIATFHSPLRIFGPLSLAIFLMGVSYYLYTYVTSHRFTNFALLLMVLSAITFALGLISEQIAALRFERSEERR